MKTKFNFRFFLLSLTYLSLGVFFRVLFLKGLINEGLFSFITGAVVTAFVYYFAVSLNSKHHKYSQLLYLVIGFILFKALFVETYDYVFVANVAGISFCLVLCGATFIKRVERFFWDKEMKGFNNFR
jgi:hypothetical protein